jgi:hypothetical protein
MSKTRLEIEEANDLYSMEAWSKVKNDVFYEQEELDALLHKKWMDTIHEMQKAHDKKLNVLEKNILTLPTISEGEYVGVCKDDIELEFAKFRG